MRRFSCQTFTREALDLHDEWMDMKHKMKGMYVFASMPYDVF